MSVLWYHMFVNPNIIGFVLSIVKFSITAFPARSLIINVWFHSEMIGSQLFILKPFKVAPEIFVSLYVIFKSWL